VYSSGLQLIQVRGPFKCSPESVTDDDRFAGEIVEEGYRFVHGNVIIYLTRYLEIPVELQDTEYKGKPKVNPSMPPYESLSPFDSENKWIMTATLQVLTANELEYMQKGTDELMKIKADFEGCFDFQLKDRHIFDTRVKA
jgi:mediator of RNA polymerase II transcription subunit 18, fungi type